jgi:predicted DNA-binding transcriptional regulator AlpA
MERVSLAKANGAARPSPADAITTIRKRDLAARLGVSPWTIDRWRQQPEQNFPQPLWLSASTPVWRVEDVLRWMNERKGPR